MTRAAFLKLNYPLLPYCEISRGPSTQFNESIHFENRNTGILLNFYWRNDGTCSVGSSNLREPNFFKNIKTVLEPTNQLDQRILIDLCRKFLI